MHWILYLADSITRFVYPNRPFVMRTHVGKLHVRRTAKKPADVHPIQIEEGPVKQAPAFAIEASAAMGQQRQAGVTNAPAVQQVGRKDSLGPFANPVNLQHGMAGTPALPADLQPSLSDLNAPGTLRGITEEDPTAELAAAADAQLDNPTSHDTEQPASVPNDDATRHLRRQAAQQLPAEDTQETPAQQQNSTAAPESQLPADAPAPQLSSPENSEGPGGEDETASPEAELPAQEPQADQPAQVPPPAAEGNDQGGNVGGNGGNGAGQGGNAGGQGGGVGGGPELTPFEQAPAALDTSGSGPMVQSLGKQQPTAIVATLGVVPGQLTTAQQGDLEQAKTLLPEIDQPTGLGSDEITDKKAVKSELKEEKSPEIQAPKDGKKQEVKTEHKTPEGKSPAEKVKTPSNEALKQPGGLGKAIQNIPEVDPSISTNAGPRPQVELTGDADPQHNQTAQNEANTSTQEAADKARTETEKDFKEGEILPEVEKETMKVQQELTAPEGWNGQGGAVLPELDAQSAAALNSGIIAQHQAQIDAELAKETQGKAEFDQKAKDEQQKGLDKIKAENEKVKQQQLDERSKGKQAIDSHREEWRAENDKVMEDFDKKSKAERDKVDGQIQTKVTETNAKVESEYAKAETEAQAATAKSQAEIDAEKQKAEDKEKDKSWWDKVCDAVSDFFDALKKAVSAIFEALKKAVKAIIEAAKQLASQLIDMARDLIKGLISAFAEMLKAFVRLALAAFPELAEKFCALIDQAVEAIHKAIDQLAEALKAVVNLLLDAIGAAINALLDAYNAIINAILSAIEFLAVGWLKIMEGIANLVKAAVQSPDHFIGQVSEELLGSDVTQPLQNEYPAEEATAETPAPESQQTMAEAPEANAQEPAGPNEALLARDAYTADDFQVPVANNENFGPELMAELSGMGEGSHEIASFDDDQHGKEAIKADAMGGQDPEAAAAESPATEGPASEVPTMDGGSPTQEAAAGTATADPNRDRFTPDGQGMVGPFSAGERARFVAGQMVDGIKKWFSENWPTIVAALIGIIAGAILANILTGGAIMAALPLVMQLVAAYFAAEAIMNMTKYFGGYLGKAFPGDIGGGAKSLARALAIGSIELVFALLFGGKAAFKAVKNVAKTAAKGGVKGLVKGGVAAAKTSIKSTAKAAKDLAKVAKNGLKTAGKNIVKGGKFVLNGLKNGFSRGVKGVRALAGKLRELRFKKFRITIQNRKWRLEGKVNPWVLLASGELVHVDPQDLKYKGKKPGASDDLLGRKVEVNGQKGIVVDADEIGKGAYTDHLLGAGKEGRQAAYKELDEIAKKASRSKKIGKSTDEVADAIRKKRLEKDFEKLFASSDEFGPEQIAAMKRALELPHGEQILEQFNWVRGIHNTEIDALVKERLNQLVKGIPANASADDLARIAKEIEDIRATIPDAQKIIPKGKKIEIKYKDKQTGEIKTTTKKPTNSIDPADVKDIPEELRSARELQGGKIHFMQNSISNPTGDFFVLQNVLQFVDGNLRKQFLGPVRTWVSKTDGKIWTLDHRRLAAYRAAGIDNVPIKWANQGEVLGDAFKMSTTASQGGKSMTISVRVNELGKFTAEDVSDVVTQLKFTIRETTEGAIEVVDDAGRILSPDDIRKYLP